MTTKAAATASLTRTAADDRPSSAATQKVLIVNGTSDVLEGLENVLESGHYDVVFVESSAHAYSQIKRLQPNLVILCVRIDDPEGFSVLSMLKLDDGTRNIPVLTYTTEYDGPEASDEATEPSETEMFTMKAALQMN